jgi:hypothetical protein
MERDKKILKKWFFALTPLRILLIFSHILRQDKQVGRHSRSNPPDKSAVAEAMAGRAGGLSD